MKLLDLIKSTLQGMGYDFVSFRKLSNGVVRIYIDVQYKNKSSINNKAITTYDCERVTHQFLYVFSVENINYKRLEISSPGLDRPLTKIDDYIRFANCKIIVYFFQSMLHDSSQKVFKGILRVSKSQKLGVEFQNKENDKLTVLNFRLIDVKKANLVPEINFRSKTT